jgi:hypothetical protein
MAGEINEQSSAGELELLRRIEQSSGLIANMQKGLKDFPDTLGISNIEEKDAALREIIRGIRELMDHAVDGQSVYYESIVESPLSVREYIVPRELLEGGRHQRLLEFLKDPGKVTTSLAHSGFLLYGETGTGKTEYVRYLMHLFGDNGPVFFANANISQILHAPAPGDAIAQLYRELQQKAAGKGLKCVLLFDEFEGMVRQFLKKVRSTNVTSTDVSSGPKRTDARTERRETNETEVDRTGEEIFSALKSVLKGTGGIDRVFTIATSNASEFEAALVSRLEPVKIGTVRFPSVKMEYGTYLLVQKYPDVVARILELMQAAHFRERGEDSSVLSEISNGFAGLPLQLDEEVASISKSNINSPYVTPESVPENRQIAINELWIKSIIKFLGVELSRAEDRWVSFKGDIRHSAATSCERIGLSQQHIARDVYLKNLEGFQNLDFAKRELALLLFPKLRELERFKETK